MEGVATIGADQSQVLASPFEAKLIVRVSRCWSCMALTDRGLGLLARRDQASVRVARKRWIPTLIDPRKPFPWRNVSGRRSRQLLRNVEHTGAIHGFIASLAEQVGATRWEIVQLDPLHRASRHFRHGDRLRSIHPDAVGVLRRGSVT